MKIRLSNLVLGINEWDVRIDPHSVELDHPALLEPLTVNLVVNKRPNKADITVTASTTGSFECDRCCIPVKREVSGTVTVLFIQRETPFPDEEPGDDMRSFFPGQDELDITTEVRDAIMLNMPVRLLCNLDCKGLCVRCGADLNESVCSCPKPETGSPEE